MAQNFDNDIELTIGIDAQEVKNSSKEVENTVKDIFNFNAGKEFDNSTKKVLSSLSKITSKAKEVRSAMTEMENQDDIPTAEYKKQLAILDKFEPVYERLIAKQQYMQDHSMDYGKQYQKLVKEVEKVGSKLDDARDAMYGLEKAGRDVTRAVDTPKYQKFVSTLGDLNNQGRLAVDKLRQMGVAVDVSTQAVAKNTPILQQIVERYRELNAVQAEAPQQSRRAEFEEKMAKRIRKAVDSVQDAIQPQKVAGATRKFADAILDSLNMETISQRASGAAKSMRKFANNLLNALTMENISAQASKAGEKLGNAVANGMSRSVNSVRVVGQRVGSAFSDGINTTLNALRFENIEKTFDNTRRKLVNAFRATFQVIGANVSQSMKDIGNKIKNGLQHPIQTITKAGSTIGPAMQKSSKTALSVLKPMQKGIDGVVKSLRKIQKDAKKSFNSFVKDAKKAWKTVKKLTSEIFKLGKSSKGAEFSFKKLFWTLMKYGIGIRSLYILVRRLRNAITEGVKNMALWRDGNNDVNRSISMLMSSMTYLKNSFGAMVAPILNVVAPALSRMIDLLAEAANMIGAFFAAITGKGTFVRAKKVMQDYAKSLNKTKDAAKEAREELASYDKLEVIKQDKDSGADDNPLGDINDMFEEVTIPDKIKELADKLKELARADKWYEIGVLIAEQLNKGMKVVDDWFNNVFRPWGVKWAKRIAAVLNGIVDTLDWELLGKTIADGMNAIADIINTFLTRFNFVNLGKGLGRAVKSWFDNIEWDLIGRTVANYFNAIIDMFYGFMREIQGFGPQVGKYLAEFWNNFMESIHLKRATVALATAINEFFGVLGGFADANKWNDHAKRVAEAVRMFFESMTWQENGANLTKFLNGLIEYVWQFFYDMQSVWGEIGKGFAEFLGELFTGTNFAKLGETLGMALNAVKDMVLQFALNFPWEEAGENFGAGVQAFFSTVDWAGKGQAANELILGILTFIKSAIAQVDWRQVGQDIGIFLDQIDWEQIFGDLFDIIWEVLSGLIGGLLDTKSGKVILAIGAGLAAIKLLVGGFTLIGTIGKWITDASPLLTKFAGLFGVTGPLAGIGAALGRVLAPIGGVVQTALAGLGGIAQTALLPVGGTILAAIGGWQIGKGIANYFFEDSEKAFKDFSFKGIMDALYDTFCGDLDVSWSGFTEFLYDELTPGGKALVDGLFDGIKTAMDGIGGAFNWLKTNIADPVTGGLKRLFGIQSPSTVMYAIGENVTAGLFNGISDKWDGLKGFFEQKVPEVISNIKGKWDELKTATGEKWEGIKTKIGTAWGTVKTTLSNPSAVTNAIKTAFTTMKTTVSTAWDNLNSKTSTVFANIKSSMINAFSEAKTKVIDFAESIGKKVSESWEGLKEKASTLYDDLKETGANAAEGLKQGIEKGKDKVVNVASKVATGVSNITKKIFRVESPSKVFAEIGEYLMRGLAGGIESEEDKAIKAAQTVADDVQDTFGDKHVGLNLDTVSMVDGLDAILDRLTSIADLFTIVTQRINDAANTIDIPDIVKGRIAPGNAISAQAQQANTDEITSLIQSLIDSLSGDENSSNKEPIVLQLNGRQVAQVVWDEEEKRYKQYNGFSPRFA